MTHIIVKESDGDRERRIREKGAHDLSEAADYGYHNWRNGDERGKRKPLVVTDPKENQRVRDELHERAGIDPDSVRERT
jgi:hypothetical protein